MARAHIGRDDGSLDSVRDVMKAAVVEDLRKGKALFQSRTGEVEKGPGLMGMVKAACRRLGEHIGENYGKGAAVMIAIGGMPLAGVAGVVAGGAVAGTAFGLATGAYSQVVAGIGAVAGAGLAIQVPFHTHVAGMTHDLVDVDRIALHRSRVEVLATDPESGKAAVAAHSGGGVYTDIVDLADLRLADEKVEELKI